MNILILGSGGREHALAAKLGESTRIEKIFVAPGNDGMLLTSKVSICSLNLSNHEDIIRLAIKINPELIIVGPEAPLVSGIVDKLESSGFNVFGPSKEAAQLEGSKIYSKDFMQEFAIPTAKSCSYFSLEEALEGLNTWDIKKGIVIKADSLAAGKGVVLTNDIEDAKRTIVNFMANPCYPVSAEQILIEEEVHGKEISAFAICDGKDFITFGFASDYKRLNDFNKGPNTGGMGGYSDKSWPSLNIKEKIRTEVFEKTLNGMNQRGIPFKGVLFAGLMIDGDEINVLEYNVRFGDPETQILLPLFKGDLFKVLSSAAAGKLACLETHEYEISDEVSVHIVMASKNYPGLDGKPMELDRPISFPKFLLKNAQHPKKNYLYFSGVKRNQEGLLVNSGGRVLGVTALGQNLNIARHFAYNSLSDIYFQDSQWRNDIGI